MATFVIGEKVETEQPAVEVTVDPQNPLPVGKHSFQLVVMDESGNESLPATVDVIVKDGQNPTAVVTAPSQVEFGQSFLLDGRRSSDVPPGRVVRFVWTLVQ